MSGVFTPCGEASIDEDLAGEPLIIIGSNSPIDIGDGLELMIGGVRNRIMVVRNSSRQEYLQRYQDRPFLLVVPEMNHYYEAVGD